MGDIFHQVDTEIDESYEFYMKLTETSFPWTTLLVHPLKTFSIWCLKTEFFQLLTDQRESHGQVPLQ